MNNNRPLETVGGGGLNGGVFHQIISLENLLVAWQEFRRGKRTKSDVAQFEFSLENNLFNLRQQLKTKTYRPDQYTPFYICDPKRRLIHKASVRDRVLFQAIYRVLYPIFDRQFIFDSYSCRVGKGTHRGVRRLEQFAKKVTANYHFPAYVLKCDVRKFFDSIDHKILCGICYKQIIDPEARWLIDLIINSFWSTPGRGLPLGNVTSQLFANIYLNQLDQFIKNQLKQKYYLRYCDDFIILSDNADKLAALLAPISDFLTENLNLTLHPQKITLRKTNQGVDFLGYIILPYRRVLRTTTKKRIFRKIKQGMSNEAWQSYLGILKHCCGHKIWHQILVDNAELAGNKWGGV